MDGQRVQRQRRSRRGRAVGADVLHPARAGVGTDRHQREPSAPQGTGGGSTGVVEAHRHRPQPRAGVTVENNLWTIFSTVAARIPDRDAIVWRGRHWTYGELADRSRRLASV